MAAEDYFDPYDCDETDDDTPAANVECKFCGKAGLHWEKLPEGWKLITAKGQIHKCKSLDPSKINIII